MCAAARQLLPGAAGGLRRLRPEGRRRSSTARASSRQPTCHHAPEVVGGVREAECGAVLREFFAELRRNEAGRGCRRGEPWPA